MPTRATPDSKFTILHKPTSQPRPPTLQKFDSAVDSRKHCQKRAIGPDVLADLAVLFVIGLVLLAHFR